jgi:hypothetical protein
MAKKPDVSKTQAVADYLKTKPNASRVEIAEALSKQGIRLTPSHVANIKSKLKKQRLAKKPAKSVKPATEAVPVVAAALVVEKPSKPGDTVTLDQIRKVAQTVKAIGGLDRLRELLELVREVGGLKKFKDLLAAMSPGEADGIPF